jgi:hypothetical protein
MASALLISCSPALAEGVPKATEGSVADAAAARSSVTESETDPLIRFADLSPARRRTAKVGELTTPQPEPLPALRGAVAEGD